MRLAEINPQEVPMGEYSAEELQSFDEMVRNNAIVERPLDGGKRRLVVTANGHYVLYDGDALVGWVKLHPAQLGDLGVMDVKMIYVVPQSRNTRSVPLLLFAVRQEIGEPISVDGDVFPDGMRLLDALIKRRAVRVKMYSRDSGDMLAFDPQRLNADHLVILESSNPLWSDHSICDTPHIFSANMFEDASCGGQTVKQLHFIRGNS
jgi:hypothetical protein